MLHLQQTPRRAPFSDWMAQVERRIERMTGLVYRTSPAATMIWGSYYDCGISPQEAAADWMDNA